MVLIDMTITMYGADWCGDCRRAKAFFADNNVDYTYVDLAEQPDQVDQVLAYNNGLKRIPVIVFADGSHLTEPSNEALAAKLAEIDGSTDAEPSFKVVENTENGNFELYRDDEVVGLATYRIDNGAVIIPHVETFPQHRGQGYAGQLMDGVLEILRADGRKIVPLCPFAAAHIRDNPQHHDLLATANR